MAVCCWESTTDIASVFDWFTQESTSAAEQTDEPRQREIWMKLSSELWGAAAQRCRDERSLSQHRIDPAFAKARVTNLACPFSPPYNPVDAAAN
jgi:hypothetical protein